MVEKITISPSEVRGYGDIVSPKTTEDFTNYMSGLTESDGVYTLVYDETGTYLNLSASPTSVSYGGSVVFTAVLTQTGEPVEGETVSFYEGETLLGSDTTDSNGEATLTKSDFTVGSHSVKAVYDEVESNAVSVSVTKLAVTVSLSADSSSITYGSNVVLSGVLSLGSGVTVTIYDGTTSLGTVTTSTGGAFSKTVTTPSAGSHSFKVEYAGDTTHDSATASTSVTVNKATPTITFASDKSVVTYGDSFTLSGVLSTGSGVTIRIIKNQSPFPLAELTTGAGGAYSKTIDGLAVGTYNLFAASVADSNYNSVTSSTITVTVTDTPTPVPASIDLTGTKSILSYADSESSVLTATVLDSSDNPVEGVDVNLYNGSTLWDTLTTDSSGECSKTYSSAGSGDITFTAEVDGTLLTKTYTVEDCLKTYMQTYLDHYNDTVSTTIGFNLPSKWKIECELLFTQSTNNSCFIRIGETDNKALLIGKVGSNDTNYKVYARNSSDVISTGSAITISNDWQPISMSFDGTTFKFNNDISVTNFNGISLNSLLNIISWKRNNYSGEIRNIKIKPL